MKLKQLLLLAILVISSCFLCFSLFGQTTTGMLAYFPLNGNTTKTGPANVSATAVGTTYTTNNANVANNAVQFAGNLNSLLDFTDNGNFDFAGTTNFTVSFSFFFNGSSTSGLIDNCLNYGGWGIWLWSTVAGTWNLQFNYKNNSVGSAAATNFTLNRWHHVAAVRNNGTISLYIDGVFRLSAAEGSTTPTYPINMIAGAMAFGSYSPPRYNPFGGKIDEIRIYNRALSATEITGLAPYALPLKMGGFSAIKKPSGIQLNWETITEQNTSHFEIERSADGINFIPIGTKSASGNTSEKKYYSYNDQQPLPGTNFYRLKMTDIDGTYTYSRIIAVKNENQPELQLFPNPVNDVLQLLIPSDKNENVIVTITDATGKSVYSKSLQLYEGNNATSLPVQHLSKGTYYLIIDHKDKRQSRIFTRQ